MNLFILDRDPRVAALYHCDKHVVKMTLETAQILSTVCHQLGHSFDGQYRATHTNHPCTVWARSSRENYVWALQLLEELGKEYSHRYGRRHASTALLEALRGCPTRLLMAAEAMTPFAQAMPEEYQQEDPVAAYRSYYLGEKRGMLSYTNRDVPRWVVAHLEIQGEH